MSQEETFRFLKENKHKYWSVYEIAKETGKSIAKIRQELTFIIRNHYYKDRVHVMREISPYQYKYNEIFNTK